MKNIVTYINETKGDPIELEDLLKIINNDEKIVNKLKEKYEKWELKDREKLNWQGTKKWKVIAFYKKGSSKFAHGEITSAYKEDGKIYVVCFSMHGGETTQNLKTFSDWV
mgnify:CR=1 FL=1